MSGTPRAGQSRGSGRCRIENWPSDTLLFAPDRDEGTRGMVTLEDVLEELFGVIEDEHDESRPLWRPLPEGKGR